MSNTVKDSNRVTDDRRKAAIYGAMQALTAGKGTTTLSSDHASGETCCQTIAKATK